MGTGLTFSFPGLQQLCNTLGAALCPLPWSSPSLPVLGNDGEEKQKVKDSDRMSGTPFSALPFGWDRVTSLTAGCDCTVLGFRMQILLAAGVV